MLAGESMIAVTVTYSLRLGVLDAFVREAEGLSAAAADGGCLRSEVLSDPTRPGKAMVVQLFPDAGTFSAFRAGREARTFDSRVVDMVTARSVSTWSQVAITQPQPVG